MWICHAQAFRDACEAVQVCTDYAINGPSAGRPRFQRLIVGARPGRFEVILAESAGPVEP